MSSNFTTQAVGLGHNDLHFFERILRSLWIVSLREHPTRGHELDQIRAVLYVLPNHVTDAVHAIGDAVSGRVIFEWQQIIVRMSAGDAEPWPAHQHSRSGHVAGIDGVAQSHITVAGRAHVADR